MGSTLGRAPITQNIQEKSRITPNPLKSLPKPAQIPPEIPPKPLKIEAKSSPDPSKSAFEDHPKYKHEKTTPKNDPRGRQSLQTPPKTLPKPLPKRAPDPSKCPFEAIFAPLFSYSKLATIFYRFFMDF